MGINNIPRAKMNVSETESEIRAKIFENTDPIELVIDPEDLTHQDIRFWINADIDLLSSELSGNIGDSYTYGISHPYSDLVRELGISYYMDDMVRVKFEHLTFDSVDECVVNGYWPFANSNTDIREKINENISDIEYFHEYESDALMFVNGCMVDAQMRNIE